MKTNVKKVRRAYDDANETAARVILADVERYGGEGSLAVIWARLFLAKSVLTIKGRLFDAAA